ncbi:MAG: methionyl-tRNA formyltransferase [Candidatus Omnitrophota bacterium]
MNIVFFGSSRFAAPSLKALLASRHRISCVVTQPDREKGRGLRSAGTAVKIIASESDARIYQPQNINTRDAVEFLKGLKPDLFVVIAYGQILSSGILKVPGVFSINMHASLLPKYRGAAPVNWAVIKGEKITGLSVMKMVEKMDAGAVIQQKEANISDDDTAVTLEERLSEMAAQLLLDTLTSIESNNYNLTPQDESRVTFAPKLKKEDGRIQWDKAAGDIYNLIRGCMGWPGAFTYYKGKLLKIYKARPGPAVRGQPDSPAGRIIDISREGIVVATGKENLIIEELQIEGKRAMSAGEFAAGHKIRSGEIFSKKDLHAH